MSRQGQRGFALVLALGAVSVVLALAAALDSWVGARVEQARLIRIRAQAELDAYSTRATVLYLLGTQRYTRAGLTTNTPREITPQGDSAELRIEAVGDEIALDGTPYRGLGRIRFALLDQAGMIAVNSEGQAQLRALLAGFSSDEAEVARLLDTLADYRDGNTLRRLNGAEQDEYERAGLEAPTNTHLRSVPELLRVLGWSEWLADHPGLRLHEWLSAARVETFNPNLVPAELLALTLRLDPERANDLVTERIREPFRSVADFNARADIELPIDDEQYRFFPSDKLQLRIWREDAAQAEMLELQLTPLGRQGPWQIVSTYRITLGRQNEAYEVPGDYFVIGTPATR